MEHPFPAEPHLEDTVWDEECSCSSPLLFCTAPEGANQDCSLPSWCHTTAVLSPDQQDCHEAATSQPFMEDRFPKITAGQGMINRPEMLCVCTGCFGGGGYLLVCLFTTQAGLELLSDNIVDTIQLQGSARRGYVLLGSLAPTSTR